MIMKANKQIGFIYKNNESIDKILKDGEVVFERGFLREKTSTTLPITFGGVGKDLKDYKVYGNTYQNSTSGKNLLETTLYNRVQQGITTTYDSEDGALILNGTATSTSSNLTEVSPLNLQPGKYIFSLKEIKPYSVQLRMTYEDNTTYSRTIPNNTKSIEVNITKTTKNQRVFIYENSTMSGTTFTNERLYVQLEEGSTATEFEPYTGGQPSPNPDYPQEIVSVGENKTGLPVGYTQVDYIESSGTQYIDTGVNADSNLRTILDMAYTDSSLTNQNIGTIHTTNTIVDRRYHLLCQSYYFRFYANKTSVDIGAKDNNRHIFNFDIPNRKLYNDENEYNIDIEDFDTELNFWLFGRNSNYSSLIYYSEMKLYSAKFYYNNVLVRDFIPCYRNSDNEVGLYDLVNNVFYTNQGTGVFTYGSEIEKGGYKIPVNVRSENLYNVRNRNSAPPTGSTLDGDYIVFDYNNTSDTRKEVMYTTNNLDLKPSTTYLCVAEIAEVSGTGTFRPITRYASQNAGQFNYDEVGFPFSDLVAGQKILFTATTYSNLSIKTSGLRTIGLFQPGENGHLKVRLSILEDTTITQNNFKYQPYYNEITNIYLDEPLRKIGNYSDYIDFINGKVVRNIKEYTLIGDEQIKMIREGMNCIKIDGKNIRTESLTMPPIFCNMLLANSRDSIYQGNVGIGYGAINNEYYNDIVMRVPNITTLTDFTTWLQSNNVTVDYVLATPTEEAITLPNIPTIDGSNTLNIETEITPSQVYIKYKSNT